MIIVDDKNKTSGKSFLAIFLTRLSLFFKYFI